MTAPKLDYAPRPPRRRKWIRRGVLVALIVALGYSSRRWGPSAWRRASLHHVQRQCLNFTAPPEQVVYEEDPTMAAKALASGTTYAAYPLQRGRWEPTTPQIVNAAAHAPKCWWEFQPLAAPVMMQLGRAYGAVVLLHELTSPTGNRRLVRVRYFPEPDHFTPSFIPGYNCEMIVITPATLSAPPKVAPRSCIIDVLSGWPRTPPSVRMFAGQPDPNNPSRFTIRYQMWGKEDILDGRLLDNDQVTLTPRNLPTER